LLTNSKTELAASDFEMGPLKMSPLPLTTSTTHINEDESEDHMSLIPAPEAANHRHSWQEAIEALILLSRALRAQSHD
jgi:hypothetical protein